MSSHLVAGVPLPDAVGGHPALDFCNTRAGWGAERPKEYLTSPLALALWAVDAGLVTLTTSAAVPPEAEQGMVALQRALGLRSALYRCALGHGDDGDWSVITREAIAARSVSALVAGADGARWVIGPEAGGAAVRALHTAAACAEDLLTSRLAGCVAACPGTGCGWLFGDPRRRRRWCSMAVCGNRAKARRHTERRGR
jgi:predicted RNA-binding Zn ribbon-like protein